jgi:hypothetical protein
MVPECVLIKLSLPGINERIFVMLVFDIVSMTTVNMSTLQ